MIFLGPFLYTERLYLCYSRGLYFSSDISLPLLWDRSKCTIYIFLALLPSPDIHSSFHLLLIVLFRDRKISENLFVWCDFNFIDNSLQMTFPSSFFLVVNFFCTDLLHSVIIWLIVSSLSPYNLHLLFCCVL